MPKLIYCAGGNKKFAEIALKSGFLYGARIPRDKPHFPIFFADQNWKKPNKENYILLLKKYKPTMATVLDLETESQLKIVMQWAEEVSQICESIVIIPKVPNMIERIPERINSKQIILGYSVPTKYSGTNVNIEEFKNRKVHLLGGSPHKQMQLWKEMCKFCEVVSVDGNYMQKMAIYFNKFWTNGNAIYAKNRWLPRLDEADGKKWLNDAPYEAFRRSCINIIKAWEELLLN